MSSSVAQLRNSTILSLATPRVDNRAHICGEIVLTRSASSDQVSNARAARDNAPSPGSSPVAKAASSSKSCTCSHSFAPSKRATARAIAADNSDGAMATTT